MFAISAFTLSTGAVITLTLITIAFVAFTIIALAIITIALAAFTIVAFAFLTGTFIVQLLSLVTAD